MKQAPDRKPQIKTALRRIGAVVAAALLSLYLLMSHSAAQEGGQEGWWTKEPIRWVQTNLRQTDAGLDARRLAEQLADMRANVVLMGMGGIAAYYPTAVEFHSPSPDLPAGRDMFGDVLRESHARKIRVDRARNSQPGKMAVDLNMQFVDYWWRFATVPRQEIALRCWQNIANGGALTFEMNGAFDQQDRQALETAKPIFRWVAAHEQYYVGQSSAARALLLGAPSNTGRVYGVEPYRGLFRLLTEEHIPFAVSNNMDWMGKREFDLVIATEWAPAGLKQYVENGGRVLLISAREPEFAVAPVARAINEIRGYVRVRDHSAFPSLKDTDLLMLNGPFTELRDDGPALLTLVPPSMFGPPELIHIDMKDTDTTAIVFRQIGKGTVAWIPWNLGGMYYRHSLPAHAGLFRDVLNRLRQQRQLRTNAHPLVEMTLMRQSGQRERTLLHLINLSGHSQTGYFPPIPMSDIQIQIAGAFKTAKTLRAPGSLAVKIDKGYTEFTIPRLSDYELVVLE